MTLQWSVMFAERQDFINGKNSILVSFKNQETLQEVVYEGAVEVDTELVVASDALRHHAHIIPKQWEQPRFIKRDPEFHLRTYKFTPNFTQGS